MKKKTMSFPASSSQNGVSSKLPRRPQIRGEKFGPLEVRQSSIHGRGVFAIKPIRKGTRIIEYTGQRILWANVPDEPDDQRTYYFGLDNGKEVIDPRVDGNHARWINHSCDPNCEAIENDRGRVFIYALRNIKPGEELFYDYQLEIDEPINEETKQESKCCCGSKNCRGTMLDLSGT